MLEIPQDANAQFAKHISKELTGAGFEALWAGGCVRDFLLGTSPKDYDIATSARPEQVRELFGRKRTLALGASFGVIVVLPPDKSVSPVEVATFRTDGGYSDGRRPDSVAFSTPQQDALRRDFTINGMFFDPLSQTIIDYVGGQEDLGRKIIRAIGTPEERISEDKLRMLRAIRFATRLGFSIQAETEGAIRRNSTSLSAVSGERVAEELRRLMACPNAFWGAEQLVETGLMQEIIPLFSLRWDMLAERARPLVAIEEASWLERFCSLAFHLCHVQSPELEMLIDGLRTRLKWSNDELACTHFVLSNQQILERANSTAWSQLQPLLTSEYANASVQFLARRARVDDSKELAQVASMLEDKLRQPPAILDPPPLLTGKDLKAEGLKPGPGFKTLLKKLRQMQLDGELREKCNAIDWLRNQDRSTGREGDSVEGS